MIGGSLKIWGSNGWFCIRFHFFIKTSFKIDTEGWHCVTKANISFSSLLLCFRSADSLSVNFISDRRFFYHSLWVASVNQALFEI